MKRTTGLDSLVRSKKLRQYNSAMKPTSFLSSFRSTFGRDYGVTLVDGPFAGLLARAVVVLDPRGSVLHTQLAANVGEEPDYEAALAALA